MDIVLVDAPNLSTRVGIIKTVGPLDVKYFENCSHEDIHTRTLVVVVVVGAWAISMFKNP